jgi:1-deoxy-D-xylulose-5-phosphate reductoisomerase
LKTLFIAGISGSIGEQALEVLNTEWFKENVKLIGGSVYSNWNKLKIDIDKYKLKAVAIVNAQQNLPNDYNDCKIFQGEDSVEKAIQYCDSDISLIATSGFSGLKHTISAINFSERICLANKESIVCGGNYVLNLAKKFKKLIIPVDSEHSAIYQLLLGEVTIPEKIILTASGGSVRDIPIDSLENVTPKEVLNHPVWSMGARITVDSATMVNKGLEVFEAYHLFGVKNIDVLINRDSHVHSIVQFSDGVFKMHFGLPNMKVPIAFSISYPERKFNFNKPLLSNTKIEFQKVDYNRYPSLQLAFNILGNPILQNAFNAADEVAVESFLSGEIKFTDIYYIIYKTINKIQQEFSNSTEREFISLEEILEVDQISRTIAKQFILQSR